MTRRSASYEYRLMKYGAWTKLNIAQLIGVDWRTELLLQNAEAKEFSHYQFITIPYGPKWGLRRIQTHVNAFLQRLRMTFSYEDLNLDYRHGHCPRIKDFNSFTAQPIDQNDPFQNYESLESNAFPFVHQRNGIDKLLKAKVEHYSNQGGLVTSNPGKQLLMTGSFEPIVSTFEEWVEDAKSEHRITKAMTTKKTIPTTRTPHTTTKTTTTKKRFQTRMLLIMKKWSSPKVTIPVSNSDGEAGSGDDGRDEDGNDNDGSGVDGSDE
ncbi:hypothetical protein BJ742DRAFT_741765 [Cladochytrium replicatum]|nr:hypothetical protein BJ742DRAFT_741765 [Cladochytrium replicatum]